MLEYIQSTIGILTFTFISWIMGKRSTSLVRIILQVIIQIIFVAILLKAPQVYHALSKAGKALMVVQEATISGTSFVFGYLTGTNTPFDITNTNNLFIFALHALPPIIVFSSLSMVLFHFGIMQKIVAILSKIFKKTLGIGGALGLFSGTKIFLGQTDAPMVIKHYMKYMSSGEIFTMMTAGMATTSFAIIGLYTSLLSNTIAEPASHILVSSIANITLSIIISKAILPHNHSTESDSNEDKTNSFSSTMEAIFSGATTGMQIVVSIITMVIVLIALTHLLNAILGNFGTSVELILGYIAFPIAYLMGLNASESLIGGSVLGMKISLNEISAMIHLNQNIAALSEKAKYILSYAVLSFGNFSSIGIQISGLSAICPEKRSEIILLAPKALIASIIVNCITATMIGMLIAF